MASASRFLPLSITTPPLLSPRPPPPFFSAPPSPPSTYPPIRASADLRVRHRLTGGAPPEDPPSPAAPVSFDLAASLFNSGDYHSCHDVLEELWYGAEEPKRTLLHGLLQCAVGLYHLFNQNHRGAMMELGEGICKLRKMEFESGPFMEFEREVSAVLEFVYQTQKELAACTDDLCVTMDGSESSYQLLGSFAAGQHIYNFDIDPDGIPFIVFCPSPRYTASRSPRARIPILHAKEEHHKDGEYRD